MTSTPNLRLPYLAAAQNQKHVTLNENLRRLDALVQITVEDRHLATPPSTPADGDRYIVPAAATGAWSGHTGKIAAFQDGAWELFTAHEGWLAWIADENLLVVFDGTAWTAAAPPTALNPALLVGVNATADTTNRLSVAAPASLFNHEGAGHQIKLNKNAATDTASLLYQTGFSGRAEIGTAGDDKLSVKISANGTTWTTAFVCDPDQNVIVKGHTQRISIGAYGGPAIAVHGTGASNSALGSVRWSNNGGGAASLFAKSRGASPAVHAAVVNGDNLSQQITFGSDGATFVEAAKIENFVDGAVAVGSVPARITFSTTAVGGTAAAERMRINAAGNIGIGTQAPATKLHVQADTTGTYSWFYSQLRVTGATDPNKMLAIGFDTTSNGGFLQALVAGAGFNALLLNPSGGNVGIGVTAPTSRLHVAGAIRPQSYTVATLPSAATEGAGATVFVSNETGGAVLAFSDGTAWRRVTDRAVVA